MSARRYTVDQDGDLVQHRYGEVVYLSDYELLERKHAKLQAQLDAIKQQPIEPNWFIITFITEGTRSHYGPLHMGHAREQLETILNHNAFSDVKVFAVKPFQVEIETVTKINVINIKA